MQKRRGGARSPEGVTGTPTRRTASQVPIRFGGAHLLVSASDRNRLSPGGTPAQSSLVLRSRAECWACTAISLAGGALELGLRVFYPLFRSTPPTTPPAPDIYKHLDATTVDSPAGSGPLRGLLRAPGPSVQNGRAAGFRLSPGSHSESHVFPAL